MNAFVRTPAVCLVVVLVGLGASRAPQPGQPPVDPSSAATIAELQHEVGELHDRLAEIEGKLTFVTIERDAINGVSGPHMIVTGCNLHLRSGSGKTDDGVAWSEQEPDNFGKYTGLGNLIIGYNEFHREPREDTDRQGAHNLVVGKGHRYPSVGGFAAGQGSQVSGRYACVTGGLENTASGEISSVSGGFKNTASGLMATVSGGGRQQARGEYSSVTGGWMNTASGKISSVSGGMENTASGVAASVSGGIENTAEGRGASLIGVTKMPDP